MRSWPLLYGKWKIMALPGIYPRVCPIPVKTSTLLCFEWNEMNASTIINWLLCYNVSQSNLFSACCYLLRLLYQATLLQLYISSATVLIQHFDVFMLGFRSTRFANITLVLCVFFFHSPSFLLLLVSALTPPVNIPTSPQLIEGAVRGEQQFMHIQETKMDVKHSLW